MADFFSGRGMVVSTGSGSRSSAYKITGGKLGNIFKKGVSGGAIALIGDVAIIDKDIALPVVCTDDYRAVYSFGKNFGQASISGTIFMGPLGAKCGGKSQLLKQLVAAFKSDRISKKKKPLKLSVAGAEAWPIYPLELELNGVKGEYNSIDFSIDALIASKK